MATINLVAILLLTPMARTLLKDYRAQLKQGIKEPVFKINKYPELKKKSIQIFGNFVRKAS